MSTHPGVATALKHIPVSANQKAGNKNVKKTAPKTHQRRKRGRRRNLQSRLSEARFSITRERAALLPPQQQQLSLQRRRANGREGKEEKKEEEGGGKSICGPAASRNSSNIIPLVYI